MNNRDEKDTDFNDLYLIEGPQAVKTVSIEQNNLKRVALETQGENPTAKIQISVRTMIKTAHRLPI